MQNNKLEKRAYNCYGDKLAYTLQRKIPDAYRAYNNVYDLWRGNSWGSGIGIGAFGSYFSVDFCNSADFKAALENSA